MDFQKKHSWVEKLRPNLWQGMEWRWRKWTHSPSSCPWMWGPEGGDLINLHGASTTTLQTSCQGLTQNISQNSDLTKHCSVSAQSNIDFLKGNRTSIELKQIKRKNNEELKNTQNICIHVLCCIFSLLVVQKMEMWWLRIMEMSPPSQSHLIRSWTIIERCSLPFWGWSGDWREIRKSEGNIDYFFKYTEHRKLIRELFCQKLVLSIQNLQVQSFRYS